VTVSIFDASARVVEAADPGLIIRPSPFREKRLGEVIAIERLRLDVARSPIPNEIDAQLGQLGDSGWLRPLRTAGRAIMWRFP